MQLNQPLNSITRSTIATMSANDLKHLLELDCMSQGTDSLDIDTIMYIMEVIAQKEKEPIIEIDAQTAQREFETTYLQSLQTESPAPAHIQKQQPTKKHRSFKRYWLVAAIVALLICAMSVSASAFEWNIFKLFASWTEDTFQFVSSLVTGEEWDDENDSPLAEFESFVSGFTGDAPIPTWVPDGFALVDTSNYFLTEKSVFMARLEHESEDILITIVHHTEAYEYNRSSEKEDPDAVAFDCDGITHYLLVNAKTATATWVDGQFEYVIAGALTQEELECMIESIY